jgi:NRAMP (natural resistance-associated macrophage protein)-like metal ion transporter
MQKTEIKNQKLFTISEFRRELGIPLVLAKKLISWGGIETVKAIDGTIRITQAELAIAKELLSNPWTRARLFVRALGPGLITGASDDDPSGIGTYSSVGAKFGMAIIWMAVWLLPVMIAVQETCARIGIVTNKGLAGVLAEKYRKRTVVSLVSLLIIANVINIGADLGAMGASLALLTDIEPYLGAVLFAFVIILMEIFFKYHVYVKIMKWLTISIFAYIITGFIIHPDWSLVAKYAFIPRVSWSEGYVFAMIAVFGTTITPYLFFWQTSEEVEEGKMEHGSNNKKARLERIPKMRTDVNTGMFLANVAFFFIVLTTANVLFANGITEIQSAEQAAAALRPLAGDWAYLLFAAGIIGTGLLAVPVLAGSSAYALSEVMKWREGLELKFVQAKGFYLIIVFSIIFGLAISLLGINPITALYWAAFINGVIAIPLLIVIMKIGNNKKIMGKETHSRFTFIFGWLAVAFMILAVIASIIFLFI